MTLISIDYGERMMARAVARDFADAVTRVLPDLVAQCPADAYPCRSTITKDMQRGARCNVVVIFQVRGEDYESRSMRAREF